MSDAFYGTVALYNAPTASVVAGATTVTINGGNALAHVREGDWFIGFGTGGGGLGVVASVTDLTHVELLYGWPGASMVAQPFAVVPARQVSSPRALPTALEGMRAKLRRLEVWSSQSIASAASIDLAAADGDVVTITGTASIAALGGDGLPVGSERLLYFEGAATLVHGAAVVLPGATNDTVAAGATRRLRKAATGVWRRVA